MNLMEMAKREMKKLQDKYPRVDGVEYDVNKRWEEGIPHHSKSEELFDMIKNVDFIWNDDSFCWKAGGDGDNGESLMYVLDIIFEELDKIDKFTEEDWENLKKGKK